MTTSCDLLIVGGGILGLWAAKYAADAGLRVTLIDKGRIGGAGSNGLLGALLPHLPNAGNDRKRFQWQALAELPALIAELEAFTGLSTGYGQCGRLMPIRLHGYRKRLQRCVDEAPQLWQLGERGYRFELIDKAPLEGWVDADAAPLGFACDDLAARASPRLVTAALKALLAPRVKLIEGVEFGAFDEAAGRALSRDGRHSIAAGQVVLAAGYETYPLLRPLTGGDFGAGIKGRSALYRIAPAVGRPILYDDGVYVVPHDNGYVAVGSTAEEVWSDPHSIDEASCAPFIAKAMALCPPLRRGELVALWAGVRPRSHAKEPMVGRLFDRRAIHVLTGGYKISFGIAHRLARALIEQMIGADDPILLPESYRVDYHFAEAKRDNRLFQP